MTGTADVIILSSSPNPPPLRSPSRPEYDPERIPGQSPRCASPPPMPSPSDLPLRSRFFPIVNAAGEHVDVARKNKHRTTKKLSSTTNTDDTSETRKPRRRTKKVADELASSGFRDPRPESAHSKWDAVEKTTALQKGCSRTRTKKKDPANKTLAGKVTKAGTDSQTTKTSKDGKKTAGTESTPAEIPEKPAIKKSNALEEGEELHLEEALRRRLDWTPPRKTASSNAIVVDDVDGEENGCDSTDTGGFPKLLSDYGFSGLASASREHLQHADGTGPTKRRRIELLDQLPYNEKGLGSNEDASAQRDDSTSSGAKFKRKTRGQSKRFTTLTARMTAQYTSKDPQDDDATGDMFDAGQRNPRRRGQSKSKSKEPEFTILSPEAAAKAFDEQDLVFGTCSQLVQEDSPRMLKETQQATQASEKLTFDERSQISNARHGQSAAHKPSFARSVCRLAGTRNLWGVAARDTDGSLIQADALDVVDLTDTSEAPLRKDQDKVCEPVSKQKPQDWVELDDGDLDPPHRPIHSLPAKNSTSTTGSQAPASALESAKDAESAHSDGYREKPVASQAPSMPQYSGFTDAELSKQVAAYGFKSIRGRKKMIDLLQKCWESKHGSANKSVTGGKHHAMTQPENQKALPTTQPQSDEITTQDLAQSTTKPKAKSKSKPKKGASQSSKNRASCPTSTAAAGQNKPGPRVNPLQSPQKPPRAHSTTNRPTSFIEVEEIQDSEEEIILSPSQVQKRYTDMYSSTSSHVKPCLDMSARAPSPSPTKHRQTAASSSKSPRSAQPLPSQCLATNLDPTDSSTRSSLPDLSMQITKAVRAQPRPSQLSSSSSSSSRSHATWHEKILMYDPIILEDLTSWLNVEGLGLVGEDREVSAGLVREWCESKGICCCWKKNASW